MTVTVILPKELRLSVHHADGTFVAGPGTKPAAVAFFFIYMNDFLIMKFSSVIIPAVWPDLPPV